MGTKILLIVFSLMIPLISFLIHHFYISNSETEIVKIVAAPKKKTLLEEIYENDSYKEHKELYENYMKINSSVSRLQETDEYLKIEKYVIALIDEIKYKSQNLQSLKNNVRNKDKLITVFSQNDIKLIKDLISESI